MKVSVKKKKRARKKNPVKRKKQIKRTNTMAKKRRSKKAKTRIVYRKPPVKRRRRKRNPSILAGFSDILINGGLAGVGALSSAWISNIIASKFFTKATGVTRNIISLLIGVGGAWLVQKYVKGKKGEAVALGMVAAPVMVIAKNAFGLNIGLAGESDTDDILDDLLGIAMEEDDINMSGVSALLGQDNLMFGSDSLIMGDDYDDDDDDEMY